MKNSVIAISSFVITTIIYALLYPIFLEMDNIALGEEYILLLMTRMIRQLHIVNKQK
jgi:hypothetical protein